MDVFKEYDVRGIYPNELDEAAALRIGEAIGSYADSETVFLGNDNRKGSLAIKQSFVKGLVKTGKQAIDLGTGPVSLPAFASFRRKSHAVCITASHNPAEYTGMLLYRDGVTVRPSLFKPFYDHGHFAAGKGLYSEYDYSEEYAEYVTRGMHSIELNIGVDCMGGAATNLAKRILESVGSSVRMYHARMSGTFYGKAPEPSAENCDALGKLVAKSGLDFGVQLDGDGDRVAFVDEKGSFVNPMTAAMIFIKYLSLKKVVATVACSRRLEDYAKVSYAKVGRPYLEEKIKNESCDFGIETSMHFYFGKYYPFSDAILASLLMASVINETRMKLSDIASEFPKIYQGEFKARLEGEQSAQTVMERAEAMAPSGSAIDRTDGIKIITESGFMLIRKSNTEPLLRVYYEGDTRQAMEAMKELASKIVNAK
ncbi:MAG: hypothetical protein ACP5T3_02125 [Candidatus Micrarchaeia archaeon]